MRNLAKTFLMGVALIGFQSCCSEAPAELMATEVGSTTSAVCCAGNCDAPAGYCCSDGTCNGNHDMLPQVAKN
ncbi:MAG: hypothetical protein H8E25_01425 [Planctomycetes bacterium]|nr:hypothetical protein [Planctomycetota bacterium]